MPRDLTKSYFRYYTKLKDLKGWSFSLFNEGVCSCDLKAIFEIADMNVKINAIESSEFPTAARPYYSV
jgi:hypothetical protein